MKNSVVVLIVALILGLTTIASAKKLPTVAEKLPANLKELIAENLDYPNQAKADLMEGDVWMKICVSNQSTIKVVDISSTNPELGVYVKNELSSIYVENPGCKDGQVYFLKVRFDISNK